MGQKSAKMVWGSLLTITVLVAGIGGSYAVFSKEATKPEFISEILQDALDDMRRSDDWGALYKNYKVVVSSIQSEDGCRKIGTGLYSRTYCMGYADGYNFYISNEICTAANGMQDSMQSVRKMVRAAYPEIILKYPKFDAPRFNMSFDNKLRDYNQPLIHKIISLCSTDQKRPYEEKITSLSEKNIKILRKSADNRKVKSKRLVVKIVDSPDLQESSYYIDKYGDSTRSDVGMQWTDF